MSQVDSSQNHSVEADQQLTASVVHGGHQNNGGPAASLFKFDPGVAIWTIIVFVLLLTLLKRFAWGPIISSIEEREKTIRDSLDRANKAQNESKRIANEQNEMLTQAKSEAFAIIQQAKNSADEFSKKIKTEALEEKEKIVASGKKEIESAKNSAIVSLKKETANLAINIAEKLIQQSMDDEKHHALIEKEIDSLEFK